MYTQSQLTCDVRALGVRPDDVITVHTSLKAVGAIDAAGSTGADIFIDAMRAAVPEGLLLIPTHTFRNIREDGPVFNVRSTMPCIGHGALRGRYPRQSRRGRGGDGLRALASCVPFRGGVRERRAGICARRPALAHPHAHDRQLWPAL